ncbi:uncharacterized protein LOC110428313 [Herrania umbratica]|uniref:Uncharacterized protein LOC110428313 n=1 Tax=Herrania umbratica TaxID=108875 RepID=A0A6J1BNG2_9ROSI|nr:uncharacterized protein LOC110428313 [Herrania umbratica]
MICLTASSLPSNLFPICQNPIYLHKRTSTRCSKNLKASSSSSSCLPLNRVLHKSLFPLAASVTIFLSPSPAKAGFLSGFSGIESVPGPQLPQIDFLHRFNEENQKKYAEADERFKSSPLLKQLLERSKQNQERNRQETLDRYCLRGAEWGIGDCSVEAMSPEEKESFIAMLKQKSGVK